MSSPWPVLVPLVEVDRREVHLGPEPDAAALARIAKDIGVDTLDALKAEVRLKRWLDGAELSGRFKATVTQTCGVTLDPFTTELGGAFTVHVLPAGSPHAPAQTHEVVIDPEEEGEPPDVLDGETIDVGAYIVEHLALEVDPFPRKPDAVFEQPGGQSIISPFAALAVLKTKDDAQ